MDYEGKADITLSSTFEPHKGPVFYPDWDVSVVKKDRWVDICMRVTDENFLVSHIRLAIGQTVQDFVVEVTTRVPGQCSFQSRLIS